MVDVTDKKRISNKVYKDSHKAKINTYMREYYIKNREKRLNARKEYYYKNREKILAYAKGKKSAGYYRAKTREWREEVILKYGGKCECCGEDRFEFLAVHHGHGNGKSHRKEMANGTPSGKFSGDSIIRWIRRNKFPKDAGIKIFCHNCHNAIHWYGGCPHVTS